MYDHKTKKNTIRPVSKYKIFIFGFKAKENKTKKERINFLVRIIHFWIPWQGLKKVYS